ncbi:MAG: hypothetical protein ACREM1_07975, partial [Longimicrobiales bacterium]
TYDVRLGSVAIRRDGPVRFEVRAPEGWQVLANGRRTDSPARPASPPADGVWRYRLPEPILFRAVSDQVSAHR